MGDVQTTFTANDADVIKAYERLKRENVALVAQQGKVAHAHEETGNAASEAIRENLMGLGKMVTGLFTVEKAVEALKKGYEEWRDAIREVAQEQRGMAHDAMAAVAATGTFAHSKEITEALGKSALGTAEAAQAFTGASEGGRTLSVEDRLGIVGAEGSLAGIPMDKAELSSEAGRLKMAIPGLTADQAVGKALRIQRLAGSQRMAAELMSETSMRAIDDLVQSHAVKSFDEAMALGLAFVQKGANPEALARIAAAVDSSKAPGMPSVQMMRNPVQKAERDFLMIVDHAERLKKMMTDPATAQAMGGERTMEEIRKVSPAEMAAVGQQLAAPGAETEAATARSHFLETPEGQALAREATSKVHAEMGVAALPSDDDQFEAVQTVIKSIIKDRGENWFDRTAGDITDAFTSVNRPSDSAMHALGAMKPEELERIYAAAPSFWGSQDASRNLIQSFNANPEFYRRQGLISAKDESSLSAESQWADRFQFRDLLLGLEREHPEKTDVYENTRAMVDAMNHFADAIHRNTEATHANNALTTANSEATHANTSTMKPASRAAPQPVLTNREGR